MKERFLRELHSPEQLGALFEYLPDVYFFVKNARSQFILANHLLLWLCNVEREEEIVGKTDHDYFSAAIADRYVRDDRYVLRTGRRIVNRIEPFQEADGAVNWYVTSKVPLFSRAGRVIGVAGMTRDFRRASSSLQAYQEMAGVLEYVERHYAEAIAVSRLARIANLSVGQFERRFKAVIGLPPGQYVIRTRINKACHALLHTARSITQIALETGFYDHSHFAKLFSRHTGSTPSEYRRRYCQGE